MNTSPRQLPIIMVTGLSGAGKSSILSALEDIAFFTIHGIPVELIPKTITSLLKNIPSNIQGIAISIEPLSDLYTFTLDVYSVRGQLQELGTNPIILFVEASIATIIKRYGQTRRPHPREDQGFSLEQAIEEESELRRIREYADIIIDTTEHTIHTLRKHIQEVWTTKDAEKPLLRIQIVTFGFKHGIPIDADMLFDVRFLPNPYFVDSLRPQTGLHTSVAEYIFSHQEASDICNAIEQYLLTVIPLYDAVGWRRLTVAIGCTGGKHRSVACAERIGMDLKEQGYYVDIEHRNISSL